MTTANASALSQLPDLLSWDSGLGLVRTSCSIYLDWMCSSLCGLRSIDPDLWAGVKALPKASQLRILLSPEVCLMLRRSARPDDEELERLRSFLEMELYLCDPSRPAARGCWTALGDFYSGGGRAGPGGSWASEYDDDRPFAAPRLGNVVIDTNSPHVDGALPPDLGETVRHPASDHALIKQRLEEGMGRLRQVSPTAAAAVREAVQVVAVAKTPEHPDRTSSSSWRYKPGMVGLANLQCDRWSAARVCDSLLHEAIHSTIYKIELRERLFNYGEAMTAERAMSPWSGRDLAVSSFTHACFVWYGLWSFWAQDSSEDEEVQQLRERAYRGFRRGPLLSYLTDAGFESITEAGRRAILDIQQRVLERSSAFEPSATKPAGRSTRCSSNCAMPSDN